MIDISKQIKMIRVEKGWTQKILAKKTGISQATICRAETSCSNIKWDYIMRILKTLSGEFTSNFLSQNLFLKEDEFITFISELKKNERVWALINYDPKKTVNLFIQVIERNFFDEKK